MTETETKTLAELDIGQVFKLPDSHTRGDAGDWVEIIDYTRPTEYGPGVYAYGDPDTGAYKGLITVPGLTTQGTPQDVAVRVE